MIFLLAFVLGLVLLIVAALQAGAAHPESGDPGRARARFTVPAAIGFAMMLGSVVGAIVHMAGGTLT